MSQSPRESVSFDSLGTVIEVRSTDEGFLSDIARLYRHFLPSAGQPDIVLSVIREGNLYSLERDGRFLADNTTRDEALMELLVAVNEATIVHCPHFVIHAGAVAREGRVVAFPGKKRAGKSTMVAALLQAGFEYASDEALILDVSQDRVICYPKAIWLTDKSRRAIGLRDDQVSLKVDDRFKSPILPEELGAAVAPNGLRLSDVVLLERRDGPAGIESLPGTDVAYALMKHSFNRDVSLQEWFQAVARVARGVVGSKLVYWDIDSAIEQLNRHVQTSTQDGV